MELDAQANHRAGTLESDGSFSGKLRQFGCRSSHQIKFSGRVSRKEIYAEFFTSASGNPPELAAKKLHCKLPITPTGSFGGTDEEQYRFWLRYRPSGGPKYQWLSGEVLDDRVFIKLTFGSPKYDTSFCHAEGWFLRQSKT